MPITVAQLSDIPKLIVANVRVDVVRSPFDYLESVTRVAKPLPEFAERDSLLNVRIPSQIADKRRSKTIGFQPNAEEPSKDVRAEQKLALPNATTLSFNSASLCMRTRSHRPT